MSNLTNDERAELEELRAFKARMQAMWARSDEKKKLKPNYHAKAREKMRRHRAKKKAQANGQTD